MIALVLLSFNPAFRIAVGDFGDVPEIAMGLDLNRGKAAFSLELGRIVSGSILDSATVSALAEGGAVDTTGQSSITTYSFLITAGIRYAFLDVMGKRLYGVGAIGFQRPQMNAESYPTIGDDFTYTIGLGGDVLTGTMFEGDFWNRTRFFLELKLYHLKVPTSITVADYEWRNVLDWKVGVTVGF